MDPTYRAVCFDLDGTLLPMDIDAFMNGYFRAVRSFVERAGLDGDRFMTALKAGTRAMAVHTDDRTNARAFWDAAFQHIDAQEADWPALLARFYAADDDGFGAVGRGVVPNPAAARAVRTLADKGYPLVLTTMPMFPEEAVRWRLRWAGIDPDIFARITHFENSRSTKPKQTYYAENLAALGLAGEEVLMVGNNTMEDLAFCDLGADAYVVTDYLLDPVGRDLTDIPHGSMEEFAAWVEALPACVDPARGIERGPVEPASMERALQANAKEGLDLELAQRQAAAIADDIDARKGDR